jgi:murein DD-endopeptidase MepM/ murein hydrolase activator NlpD
MIVPHQGKAVFGIKIPIKAIKCGAVFICIALVLLIGTFVNYRYTVNTASVEQIELNRLRQVNSVQAEQIEKLAKETAALQQDMNRLDQLDIEIRRVLNNEESTDVSRSGVVRPDSQHGGQGGPMVKPDLNELANLVKNMQNNAKEREQSLAALKQALIEKNERLAATPSIWPAAGEVSSRFGWRSSPWGGWGSDYHPGLDIANDIGTPIVAAADGVVVSAGWNSGGYGNLVQIDHGNGIVTLYGHNSSNAVSVGQQVHKGDVIAYMGSTGNSTGPHVHYEVRVNGTAVNPAGFL